MGGERLASSAGISWEALRDGLFDTSRLTGDAATRLGKVVGRVPAELIHQDWEAAALAAELVIEERGDLAWPFAICGWAAERCGDAPRAEALYARGSSALGSSASFTSDWLKPPFLPHTFALRRLAELKQFSTSDAVRTYLTAAMSRDGVHDHFLELARSAEADGKHAQAYECFYRAGWDCFSANDHELLQSLERTANAAGWAALCAIARLHANMAL